MNTQVTVNIALLNSAKVNGLPVTFEYLAKTDGQIRVRVGYVESLTYKHVCLKDQIRDEFRTCTLDRIQSEVVILGSR